MFDGWFGLGNWFGGQRAKLAAGELRDQIMIQAAADVPDGGGGKVTTWADADDPVWAKIEPLTGGEAFAHSNASELITIIARTLAANADVG